ncbi:MAG: cytochrome c-type biogenesis protein CcmH [Microthrixaceae bacterium]|nr:cytochrome c-type biogenesis protein CcmH [Microthrixaceae bacterium]
MTEVESSASQNGADGLGPSADEHVGVADAPKGASTKVKSRRAKQRQRWWWWLLMAGAALAVIVSSSSKPPTEGVGEERLFYLASQLKCVQCVGESVAGSAAPIAVQFRSQIREQMGKGLTNDEILDYFASRYDDVLLTPPSRGIGSLVWVLPVVVIGGCALGLGLAIRRWSETSGQARVMTDEDESLVAEALADDD